MGTLAVLNALWHTDDTDTEIFGKNKGYSVRCTVNMLSLGRDGNDDVFFSLFIIRYTTYI